MTRKQLIGRTLTEKELEQVSGGAASNIFYEYDSNGDAVPTGKVTGSYVYNSNDPFGKNVGALYGDQGATNLRQHAPKQS